MRDTNFVLSATVLAVASTLGGWLLYHHWQEERVTVPSAMPGPGSLAAGTVRPDFTLADLKGQAHSISQWDGKVILLNFWATWCPPCRREIPSFVELFHSYQAEGFVVVGVAIDQTDKVREFVAQHKVVYPTLIGDSDAADISARYGNVTGALPYSVVIDRTGHVVTTHRGLLSKQAVEQVIRSLL